MQPGMSFGLLLALMLVVPVAAPAQKAKPANPWERIEGCTLIENEWNDGDSFHVLARGKEVILRLYFVDCPETDNTYSDRVKEQAEYFATDAVGVQKIGKAARDQVLALLRKEPFTVWTRWRDALGRSTLPRFYALVIVDGRDLNEILVERGLARIYGTRVPLPDGRSSADYLKKLREIEIAAKTAKKGGPAGSRSPKRADIRGDAAR
jgi:endonuclease YncB( thermonuclease family)